MQPCLVETAIARKFGLDRAPTLLAQPETGAPIAFSRLHCNGAYRGPSLAAPPEEAYSFQVALMPVAAAEIWVDGRHKRLSPAPAGTTYVYDLTTSSKASLVPPFDFLRFHLPVAALDRIAYERGLRRPRRLRTQSSGQPDPVLLALAQALLPMIAEPATGSALFLDYIALAFHAHVLHRYGGADQPAGRGRAGLAPWQLRRAYAFMEERIDGDPSIAELARECRLSASHFARAFRQATGHPPHRWLLHRRVERAKELLVEGEMPLAQVAQACGFVDQSHLNRVFTRAEGHSPGKWRRIRGDVVATPAE